LRHRRCDSGQLLDFRWSLEYRGRQLHIFALFTWILSHPTTQSPVDQSRSFSCRHRFICFRLFRPVDGGRPTTCHSRSLIMQQWHIDELVAQTVLNVQSLAI